MTGQERISRILQHKPVDRIGVHEHFWNDTHKQYVQDGSMREDDTFELALGLDITECWAFNLVADLDFKETTLEETEDSYTTLDGNGAVLRRHKHHDTTPEHIDFRVKTSEDWKQYKPLLQKPDVRRIQFDAYRKQKAFAGENGLFFVWSGVNVFECIHPVCGHEHMLVGMALEPEWIADMAETYANLTIELQKILFEAEGWPDGIWYYEDMGFKERPFMSPSMYTDLIFPSHQKTIGFAHQSNCPVIMHSCGFVEPLLPKIVEAGIDCLQAVEVKAGMDLLRIHKNFGDKIALMGGIDVRALYSNDKKVIDAELESKIPIVKQGYGYVLHSDHSIPKDVGFESLQYFIERGIELGTY